ncbi:PREDICTED: copper transporter 6-like [Erythranthe guttata]|uniref:copper transporter 6-like n=1 Tax=Erythranthe guttata TaxID=4155 RepID=UPI00064DEBAE|nr:PREDICTED: copper transporter 6-like [Erythranthe guttata]|eukprot:XP_012850206.1 PREDICTED: copper transporter 6-like [Erythranthe guttata]
MLMPMPSATYKNESFMLNMGDEMITMQMSFFWGKDVVVLFDRWPGNGHLVMYILALALVFFLAVAAELLSVSPNLKPRGLSPLAGAGIHAAVYGVRMGLAYLIMLSVMSFNVGIFLVAVVGHAAGCFIVKYRALSTVARAVDPES